MWLHILPLSISSGLLGIVVGIIIGTAVAGGDTALREWVGALSGWVAGGVALVGAVTAWIAINKQIEFQRDENRLVATQTLEILDRDLHEFLSELNQSWRMLEYALDCRSTSNVQRQSYKLALISTRSAFQDLKILAKSYLLENLLPAQKLLYGRIFNALDRLNDDVQLRDPDPDEEDWSHRVDVFAINLSHLAKYVEKATPCLRDIFKDRTSFQVDHTPRWRHREQSVDKKIADWEKEIRSQ
ncbi:hypothetical protein DYI23_02265 [Roseibium polysiphoniae]|uniref:Uncharacterized protein n=1 Tax=Roseibium polysiphoniae TaxID=2571221 RepID=A0A944C7D5_9HYPH|nr:hypothetical protein [Roseibium polysiphoniae]